MNVNEEILQNGEEENQNENGSSKQPESAKKGTKKNPAKAKQINIKTEKKEASSMAPTMLSKLVI